MSDNEPMTIRCCEHSEGMSPLPKKLSLAMSYISFQCYKKTYSSEDALQNGTLFPDLDKPTDHLDDRNFYAFNPSFDQKGRKR